MGALSYCFMCAVVVRDRDFAAGAVRADDRVACAACARTLGLRTPPPAAPPRESTRRRARPEAPSTAPPRRWPAAVGIAGALAAVALGFAWMQSGPEPEPSSAVDPRPTRPAPGPPPPTREQLARAAFDKALAAPTESRRPSLEDVRWRFEGTAAALAADAELQAIASRRAEALADAFREVDAALAAGRLEDVRAKLDVLEGRFSGADWDRERGRRESSFQDAAAAAFPELRRRALEAADAEAAARIVAVVERWRIPAHAEALKAALAAPAPAPVPEKAPEAAAWRTAWAAAMEKAAIRDFAGARTALGRAAAGLKDEDLRAEAAADLSDLQALESFHAALIESAASLPRFRGLAVDVRAGDGTRRLAGVVQGASPHRVELRTAQGTVFAEWSDVTAASLAASFRRPDDDPRIVARAGALEGAPAADLPPRWADWAAAVRVPPPPAVEQEARALFRDAEREFLSPGTLASAVDKYRRLRDEFAATALVRSAAPRILRRADAGQEYTLAPEDLAVGGTFSRGRDGRVVSTADSDPSAAPGNFVELAFAAMPEASYRAWVLLGGCCRETFTFYLQGSEMTAAARGKKVSIEPGGGYADTVQPYLSNLRRTHAEHAKGAPKAPARWEWVAIPLPKYQAPGAKRIRILTDQAGFGVGGAVVSATRTSPPKSAEFEDLARERASERPAAAPDPDLAAYWDFDEEGESVPDLSGRGRTGRLIGGGRGPGRIGGAVVFTGAGRVEVVDDPGLRFTGDYTIALWVRKDRESEEWTRWVGKGEGDNRPVGLWEFPGEDARLKYQFANQGAFVDIDSARPIPLGAWCHVAAVKEGRRARLYIDGRADAAREFATDPPDLAFPLTLSGGPHGGFMGALDDVRIYVRALSAEEIAVLAETGR